MAWRTRRKADQRTEDPTPTTLEAPEATEVSGGTATLVTEHEVATVTTGAGTPSDAGAEPDGGRSTSTPWLLVRAAHPLRAVLTALGLALGALVAGRDLRECLVVLIAVLTGQAVLGWHNDLVDRDRDTRRAPGVKPLTTPGLESGTVWFAIICAALVLLPSLVGTGILAGVCYLLSLVVGLLGNLVLRRGALSWVPWAVAFGLYPAYLSYGGWGGQALGSAPSILMTLLAAALGVGVHVLSSSYDLLGDHEEGWRTLPVRLGLRLGAGRLLTAGITWTGVVLVAMAVVGATGGLRR